MDSTCGGSRRITDEDIEDVIAAAVAELHRNSNASGKATPSGGLNLSTHTTDDFEGAVFPGETLRAVVMLKHFPARFIAH